MTNDAAPVFTTDWFLKNNLAIQPRFERYWIATPVVGPYDACVLSRLREMARPYFSVGDSEPVDVFVLSSGPAPLPECTKIGGRPYFGIRRTWPRNRNGELLPFLAQFNFRDSSDISPKLPGDVLLIFAEPSFESGVALEWERIESAKVLCPLDALPVELPRFELWGSRWRTNAYPSAEPIDDEDWGRLTLPDGNDLLDPPFLFTIAGMQIGASPYEPPPPQVLRPGERIICSVCNVHPSYDVPYPFLNCPRAMSEDEAERASVHLGIYQDSDSFAFLYIIMTEDGTIRWQTRG